MAYGLPKDNDVIQSQRFLFILFAGPAPLLVLLIRRRSLKWLSSLCNGSVSYRSTSCTNFTVHNTLSRIQAFNGSLLSDYLYALLRMYTFATKECRSIVIYRV